MIALRRPLAALANRMPWSSIEATFDADVRSTVLTRAGERGGRSVRRDAKARGCKCRCCRHPRLSVQLTAGLAIRIKRKRRLGVRTLGKERVITVLLRGRLFPGASVVRPDSLGTVLSAPTKRASQSAGDGDRGGGADEGGYCGQIRTRDCRHHGL